MGSDADTADFILEQIAGAGAVGVRKMFGEYAVYCDGKTVGLICDNQLFIKPTASAKRLHPDRAMGIPYPGAKPQLHCDDLLDDPDTLCALIRAVADDLPPPKPKKPRKA